MSQQTVVSGKAQRKRYILATLAVLGTSIAMSQQTVAVRLAQRKRYLIATLAVLGASIHLVIRWFARRRRKPFSQDDMKRIFGPKFREDGTKIEKVGWRLAREAKVGEVVCTVIDGHLVERRKVQEKGSMVIQQDSMDKELYVLGPEQFRKHYLEEHIPLRGVTDRVNAWRTRGYRFYQRRGEWLTYEVKDEDLDLVPGQQFEAPYTRIPTRLHKGDVLVTEAEAMETIYVSSSRNRPGNGQVGTRGNAEVFFVYASPLDQDELKIVEEINSIVNSGALLHLTCGIPAALQMLKSVWTGEEILHVSAHGGRNAHGGYKVILESETGATQEVNGADNFIRYVIGEDSHVPRIVLLNLCDSEEIADKFLERGVQYVIALRGKVHDTACRCFAQFFYNELDYSETGSSITGAFELATKMMRDDANPVVSGGADHVIIKENTNDLVRRTSFKHLALPAPRPKGLALRVPFVPDEGKLVGPLVACDFEIKHGGALNAYYRKQAMRALHQFKVQPARIIHVVGDHGIGKATFAKQLARFAALPGGRFFSGGAIVPSSKGVTQQQMKSLFLHKMEAHGIRVSKQGQWRLARPAKNGESIPKVENGQVVTLYQVTDNSSFVIQQDSVDRELYVLPEDKFKKNFNWPGVALELKDFTDELEFQIMQRRGFKWFERKGELLLYKVVEEDLEAFPDDQREFEVPFSLKPQELRLGDPLVTGLPDKEDIYVTRNAVQVYKLTASQREALDKPRTPKRLRQTSYCSNGPDCAPSPQTLTRAESEDEWVSAKLELQLSIIKQASKQNWLSARWYNPDGHHAAPRLSGSQAFEEQVAEQQKDVLGAWLDQLPENYHALCILMSPERQLKHEQCRQYIIDLLSAHPRLHILIINNSGDWRARRLQCPDFGEDRFQLDNISDKEAARLFLELVKRVNFPSGASWDEVLCMIDKYLKAKHCDGSISRICELAESYLLDPTPLSL